MSPTSLADVERFAKSAVAGYENLAVWADLLDAINVFPVADGDTGANLKISLSPLRECETDFSRSVESLSLSALGNSGNIAVAFFTPFLQPGSDDLLRRCEEGRKKAYGAVQKPLSGTMLDLFDALCDFLHHKECLQNGFEPLRERLRETVIATSSRLNALVDAGVVDSGALGMFLFFDGFFQCYLLGETSATPVKKLFAGSVTLPSSFQPEKSDEYCVEAILAMDDQNDDFAKKIASLGQSAVVVSGEGKTKLHVHTTNPESLRSELASYGDVVSFSGEAMAPLVARGTAKTFAANRVRIMSDAAGSIPLALAKEHGILLLDSYLVTQEGAVPESLYKPDTLYKKMGEGERVSTAQASNSERELHYQAACGQYEHVLYICTGSAFTGNFAAAMGWKKSSAASSGFSVIDSGAASGRLAVIALLSARLAETGVSAARVIQFAEKLSQEAEEFVFIGELKYLVAGGRVSKTKAFFADLFHKKPVIRPWFDGVQRVAVVRDAAAQLEFALKKLGEWRDGQKGLLLLLQYTDNKAWLHEEVLPAVQHLLPETEIHLIPLSLTSGVHMGPGTWSLAYGYG